MIENRSLPTATVIPVLVYPDVRAAVAWLTEAFGFEERVRIGDHHRSQMRVGEDGGVILADVHGDQQTPQPGHVTHILKVRVATSTPPSSVPARTARGCCRSRPSEYGERECTVEDPARHRWQLTQTMRDVAPEEWGGVSIGA